ncbi:hypothetical protein ACHAWC_008962 [Mediolabrus comicus]
MMISVQFFFVSMLLTT